MKLNRIIVVLFFSVSFSFNAKATDVLTLFDSANAAYSKADYDKALILYDSINNMGYESAELYYNIGNTYFKTNKIGYAIAYYEKAKKINPSIQDIENNLDIANQRIEDKIDVRNSMFLSEVKNSIVDSFSEKGWSLIFLLIFAFTLLLFFIYFVSSNVKWKKVGFYSGVLFLFFSIVIFFAAKSKYDKTLNSQTAIVISSSVTVMGSPSDVGTKLFIIHEGVKVSVSDEIDDYTEITLPNGKSGWVKKTVLLQI
jgi:tetratricopeptide (TPR) repeat protein